MGSPYINRFLQPDTVLPNPTNSQAWNRFSYVKNNPIIYNDPTGHCEAVCVLIIIAVELVAAGLIDMQNDNQIDDFAPMLAPDALIYSGTAVDSTGMFMQNKQDPKALPLNERDVVFTTDQGANFNTAASSGGCLPNVPCVNKPQPYITAFSPTADLQVSAGLIWSQKIKEDVRNFEGDAYNFTITAGPVSLTAFWSIGKDGRRDRNVFGLTVGKGISPVPSIGSWYSFSEEGEDESPCTYQKKRIDIC